jgi:hypothetical protein
MLRGVSLHKRSTSYILEEFLHIFNQIKTVNLTVDKLVAANGMLFNGILVNTDDSNCAFYNVYIYKLEIS